MIPFNYMAYYLAEKLNITETFVVGGKVTEVFLKAKKNYSSKLKK